MPAVAGQFYNGTSDGLRRQVEGCFIHRLGPGALPGKGASASGSEPGAERVRGGVAPHAGFMYSGPVAAHLYYAIIWGSVPGTFVIIGPNHSGYGEGVALSTEDFQTPMGIVKRDEAIGDRIAKAGIARDDVAHNFEHSLEVQLPFIQHIAPEARIVAICMRDQSHRSAMKLGAAIRKAIRDENAIVIASTDFSHYVPAEVAKRNDSMAIDAILKRDPRLLEETVRRNRISMCGYGPVMAMLEAARPESSKLLKYATSGDVSPMREVVGYAAVALW
ncbi:MAG: AmmeMemoRadiSam system protein B [Euryarchaeota archaeon]|nr:AmmeMemoRadiSam system protein B [Euryarchaeota archaeon]